MKITAVSPHLDDVAFSIGLSVATWIEARHSVNIVNCFTRGEHYPFGDDEFIHANDRRTYVTAMRHREDVRWSRLYRVRPILHDVNLRDAPQRLNCGIESVCTEDVRPDDPALHKIRRRLNMLETDALILPLAIGDHVDHRTAKLAAEGGWPESLPIAFYEDLPYAARPGGRESILTRVHQTNIDLEPQFAGSSVDVRSAVELKRKFALCYDSQIDTAVAEDIAHFCEHYQGRERLWVNRAWQQSLLAMPL